MADFDVALKRTLEFEGGYSNDPQDPGGETNFGITEREAVRQGYNGDMRTIPMSMVQFIYHTSYWNSMQCDRINDQQIANHLFDCGVNMGSGTAGRILQKALNGLFDLSLIEDGIIGFRTVEATNVAQTPMDVVIRFCELRKSRYDAIIQARPASEKFRHGWYKRCTV